jgi:renalase
MQQRHLAVIGAGLSGVTCARTLHEAGHRVQLFEKSRGYGGRMATRNSPFGSFDHGAQYFTQRDPRFAAMLSYMPGACKAWAVNIHNLHIDGLVSAPASNDETHWISSPRMSGLPQQLAQPLAEQGLVALETRVMQIVRQESEGWQLHLEGPNGNKYTRSGFDGVVLAMPAPQTLQLLQGTGEISGIKSWVSRLGSVTMAPCWTLMLSFSSRECASAIPLWNAARSASHSVAWLARESSKPDRGHIERWILQASHAWSSEHFETDKSQVHKLLIQSFAEITGIKSEPSHVDSQRWRWAQTVTSLGQSHLWNSDLGIGICGDWCLGHRVECAFISGLELAQAAA